jgi:hypothetical protein
MNGTEDIVWKEGYDACNCSTGKGEVVMTVTVRHGLIYAM